MTASRGLHAATIARAAAPVLLLLLAMGVPSLAVPTTLVLATGAAIAIGRSAPVAWAWAAMVPAAALASVRAFSGLRPLETAGCGAFDSPRVTWAIAEALVVLATFTALAMGLQTRRASIGLRMPARAWRRLAVAGFAILAVGGLGVISLIRGAIPGPAGDGDPSATEFLAAVLVGAAAIAFAEELAFRGVLQHWLARTVGEVPAIVVQAAAYGVWVAAVGWGPAFGIAAAEERARPRRDDARHDSCPVVLAWHWGVAVALLAAMLCG